MNKKRITNNDLNEVLLEQYPNNVVSKFERKAMLL